MKKIDKIGQSLEKIIGKMISALMAVLIIVVFLQVVLRYVFHSGMAWAEELERMIFIWLMFFGIALGIYKKKHFSITALVEKMGKFKKSFNLFIHIITCVFMAVMSWAGFKFTMDGFGGSATMLPVKLGFLYSIIPIASGMSIIFCILLIIGNKEDNHD